MNEVKEAGATSAYKIVLLGDIGVGKTFIVHRFVKGTIPKSPTPTIGVEFSTRTETLSDSTKVKAQIWDTAGQERYRSITSAHFRKAVGALLVFDLTKEKTFSSVGRWAEELKFNAGTDIKILLVGNKLDLVKKDPSQRAVSREEAQTYAEKNGMMFIEASALEGDNVRQAFIELLEAVHKGPAAHRPIVDNGISIDPHSQTNKKAEGCAC